MAKSLSIFELNEFIRRVLALNLSEAVWVQGELAQINENRGHHFLTLVQKASESEEILAQSEAVIWQRTYRSIRRKTGRIIDDVLRAGMEIKILVRVDFNERYGLKLIIEDIDPNFTLGELERQKRESLEKLEQEGLLLRNASLKLPAVLQRIAVLSSPEAAGLQDFLAQIQTNSYGYAFQYELFPAAVQGAQVWSEMQKQLKTINRRASQFDCLVLIRGGGSRTDLAAFDQYPICAAFAQSALPLLTGIGHEIDETLVDRVAHLSLKTPTAVADFLLTRNLQFENQIHDLGLRIQQLGRHRLRMEGLQLGKAEQSLFFHCRQQQKNARFKLNLLQDQLPQLLKAQLQKSRFELEKLEQSIQLLDPDQLLKRGYSLSFINGKLLHSIDQLKVGDEIITQLADGQFTSQVKQK